MIRTIEPEISVCKEVDVIDLLRDAMAYVRYQRAGPGQGCR